MNISCWQENESPKCEVRESIPRQVDKKAGVPEVAKAVWGSQIGDRGLEFSRRRKGQTSFFLFVVFWLYIP